MVFFIAEFVIMRGSLFIWEGIKAILYHGRGNDGIVGKTGKRFSEVLY
jgi:hypothetical protein